MADQGDDHGYLERAEVTDPRTIDLVEYEHRARYLWAAEVLGGGEILDVACGTGHGSEILARLGPVTGIDVAPEAVERARGRTTGTFIEASVPPIPLDTDGFDAIVSFETIEHIEEDGQLVAEFSRVLKPGGVLLISSPNSAVTSPDGEVGNQFHVREYTLAELKALLVGHGFEVVDVLGQGRQTSGRARKLIRSVLWRTRLLGRASETWRRFVFDRAMDRAITPATDDERPEYWVLRCRANERREDAGQNAPVREP